MYDFLLKNGRPFCERHMQEIPECNSFTEFVNTLSSFATFALTLVRAPSVHFFTNHAMTLLNFCCRFALHEQIHLVENGLYLLVFESCSCLIYSHYLIRVASLGKTLSEARDKLRDITSSRQRRAVNGNNDVHIAGKLNSNVVPTTFKVGQGQIEGGYTNKRLTLGHFYAFSVESCVLDENEVCLCLSAL